MTVLVTGATGKTGKSLVARLRHNDISHRAASRSPDNGEPPFDWGRPETWTAALDGVSSVYLVAPPTVDDPYAKMIEFLGLAARTGDRRLVFLGMASLPAGGPAHGQVHQWLKDNSGDWAVISPSAFMQNFSEGAYLATILEEATFYSNTAAGRVPFISADDIASAAFAALTATAPPNRDFVITGEQSLDYDEVAEIIGQAAGRPISHTRISTQALIQRFLDRGLPETTAMFLAYGYETIAHGIQDRTTDDFTALTGERPMTFQAFAEANASVWNAASDVSARA